MGPLDYFENPGIAYSKANYNCANLHYGKYKPSRLASIHSQKENDYAKSLCQPGPCWIGLTDRFTEGDWIWEDKKSPMNYKNWASGKGVATSFSTGRRRDMGFIQGDGTWNEANYGDTEPTIKGYFCRRKV